MYSSRRMDKYWHIVQLFKSFICFIHWSLVSHWKTEGTEYFHDAQVRSSWRLGWHPIRSALSLFKSTVRGPYCRRPGMRDVQSKYCIQCTLWYPLIGVWRIKWYCYSSNTNARIVQRTDGCFGTMSAIWRYYWSCIKITRYSQQYPVGLRWLNNCFNTTTFC